MLRNNLYGTKIMEMMRNAEHMRAADLRDCV